MSYPSHLRVYHYIREIARLGSLNAASEQLNIAVSALSRWVNTTEEHLGCKLFTRLSRGLELTEAGKVYIDHANKLLDDEARLRDRIKQLSQGDWGSVRIASIEGAGETLIPNGIARLSKTHTEIEFEILIGSPQTNLGHLIDRRVDFGIFLNRPDHNNLLQLFEYPAPLFAEMRSGHPLAGKACLSLEDIADYPLLLPSKDTSIYQLIQLAFAKEGLPIKSNIHANSILPQRSLVAQTDYITFGSPLHWEPWVDTTLRRIEHPILTNRSISVFSLPDRPLSTAAEFFLEVIQKEIVERSEHNAALFE